MSGGGTASRKALFCSTRLAILDPHSGTTGIYATYLLVRSELAKESNEVRDDGDANAFAVFSGSSRTVNCMSWEAVGSTVLSDRRYPHCYS
jgi:hypothetical protein